MKTYSRADRVGALIQEALADILRKKIKDPYLQMATITGVVLTPDLKSARIYFVITGDETARKRAEKGFQRAHGFLKKLLSRELTLRCMPEVIFIYDESFDYGSRIDAILKSIESDDGPNPSAINE